MSFLDKLSALIPFAKKVEVAEYFFVLNITSETLTTALWTIEGKQLRVYGLASEKYQSLDNLIPQTDKLLDESLGIREIEPQKILFGVPNSWLVDENLKDEYMKVLRQLVKELELQPMAYVENAHALIHFLEKNEGVPPTAILIGFESQHITVTVVRAGKLDGVRFVAKGESSGSSIEKALLSFTDVETLPSKILIYGDDISELKDQLLDFPWMSKLPFLHFPKIDILPDGIGIKSLCFAGASEIAEDVLFTETQVSSHTVKSEKLVKDDIKKADELPSEPIQKKDLGFVVGDISSQPLLPQNAIEIDDFEHELPAPTAPQLAIQLEVETKKGFSIKRFIPTKSKNSAFLIAFIGVLLIILTSYLLLVKAEVKIFVEPKIVEKDTIVSADPNQKTINEESKIIPGQIVETEVSSTAKEQASGQKQIGDPARGTVKIVNNTNEGRSFSKGTVLTTSSGLKFTLNNTASVSATPTDADSKSTKTVEVTAVEVGADGNLPSGTNLTIANIPSSQFVAKAEGNFSGGTSKQVVVVSSDDQKRLLASLASSLRKQAQIKLQEKLPQKKILEEALNEEIIKKSFSKNINDAASEFSLNLTAKYKGTAFEDKDLKLIVSKLVSIDTQEGFELDLEDTETQADVSKLEKGGKLIFLAKFRAKLMPKINSEMVKKQIKGKSLAEATETIKSMNNVLGSEIQISPKLPSILQRLPMLEKNIKVEIGLK